MDSFVAYNPNVRGSTPHIDVHHGCVRVSFGSCRSFGTRRAHNRPPKVKRGDVERFTPSSRRRLRLTLASIRLPELPDPRFITLTYHNDWEGRSHAKDLANWLRTIKHRFGDCHYLWRVELQKRGAPHFHIMLWQSASDGTPDAEYVRSLRMLWAHVTEQGTEAHRKYGFHSVKVNSGLGALMAYLRKYLAKEDDPDHDHPYTGRRWATSRQMPTSPYLRVDLNRAQTVELRRFARKVLRARFRRAPHRKQRVRYLTDGEYLTLYLTWQTVARFLASRDVPISFIQGESDLPWDSPHI